MKVRLKDVYDVEIARLKGLSIDERDQIWGGDYEDNPLFRKLGPPVSFGRRNGCLVEIKYGCSGPSSGDEKLDAIIRADERIPNLLGSARLTKAKLPIFAELHRMIDRDFPHVKT
jgi:hypothetical protein